MAIQEKNKAKLITCSEGDVTGWAVKLKSQQAMMALQEMAVLNGFNVVPWC